MKKRHYQKIEFDVKEFKTNKELFKGVSISDQNLKLKSSKTEMIIFSGSPGSGKSTFFRSYLEGNGYIHVNQDTLRTAQKCYKVAEENLKQGKSVVIDNTNPKADTRQFYSKLAKELGVGCRSFIFNFPKDLVFHLNEMRSINRHRTHNSKNVADVIVHTWYKNFSQPTKSEGFSEILEVNFVPGPFKNNDDENTFFQYT